MQCLPLAVLWRQNVNFRLLLIHLLLLCVYTSNAETTICLDGSLGVDNASCWSEGCSRPCGSLIFALLGAQRNNFTTLLIYDGTYYLSQNFSATDFYNFANLAIIGLSHRVHFICGEDGIGGMAFTNCNQISITNITISGCGAVRNSTSRNYVHHHPFTFLDFNVTLYFLFCTNVTLTSVTIANSTGTGVVMYATVGVNTITFCAFLSNNAMASGGGLYIEFPYCIPGDSSCLTNAHAVPPEFVAFSLYRLSNCNFDNNVAYAYDSSSVYILPHKYNHLAFGRGGGLSVFFKGYSHDNTIEVSYCNFTNNMAIWGGGVLSEHQDLSSNNTFVMEHCIFQQNSCVSPLYPSISNANGTGGGGIRLGYIFFGDMHCTNNSLILRYTKFINNSAYFGGGVSFYAARENSAKATNSLQFHNCSWFANTARLGSAVDLALWHPIISGSITIPLFNNSIFFNNYYVQQLNQYMGIGAVYSDSIPVLFTGETIFSNNSNSALVAVATYLRFDVNSSATFNGNSGRIGAALALLGNAFIVTSDNSELIFVDNLADLKGGAIFGEVVGEHDLLSSRNCFIRYNDVSSTPNEWKSRFYFRNNNVKTATLPNAIYATTVITCAWGGAYGSSVETNLNSVFNWSTMWHYDDFNVTNEINTSPLSFNYTNGSSPFFLIPGKSTMLPITALDDNGRNVTSSLVITIQSENSSSAAISDNTQYISDNAIVVYGNNSINNTTTFVLQTIDPKVIYFELHVALLPCPPGMVMAQRDIGSMQCICGSGFGGVVKCDNFKSRILQGQWMGWVDSQYVVGDCVHCNVNGSVNLNDVLPDSNMSLDAHICGRVSRTGILCGRCLPSYGLTANLVCAQCLYSPFVRVILYIATQFVPVTIFFLVLMLFNVSITSGPINSFVFFAQMITTACDITVEGSVPIPEGMKYAFTTIYEIWNLNFLSLVLPSVCLSEDLSSMQIQLLQYVNAFYPLLLILLFCVVLSLYDRGFRIITCLCRPLHIFFARFKRVWNLKGSAINAVAAFFLLSYFKFTSVSLVLLSPATLYDNSGNLVQMVLLIDGNIPYLGSKHVPYFALGMCMICLFVAVPPVILIIPSIARTASKLFGVNLCTALQNSKTEQFLNMYDGCYRNGTERSHFYSCDLRWFSGFYFALRFGLLIIYTFSPSSIAYPLQQMVCMVTIVMLASLRPYKNNLFNIIDIIFFANLVLIMSITMYNYLVVTTSQQNPPVIFLVIQFVLLLWPALYVMIFTLYTVLRPFCGDGCCKLSDENVHDYAELLTE